mgnify:FL=1|jgi:hypothetical protein
MPTYKNITIPKRGGGTRKQRVQVLASGKYKFVKNLKKKARKAVSKARKPKRRVTRSSGRSRRKTTVAKKGSFFGNLSGVGMVEDAAWGYFGLKLLGNTSSSLPTVRVIQGVAGHALGRRGKGRLVYGLIDLLDVYLAGARVPVLDSVAQLMKIRA